MAEHYRNFAAIDFHPAETVNIIYGDNAQGKTNLLEAVWMFTGGKSFRGAKDSELIRFGSGFSRL
jgi:DNA replication and repair protein RecF